MIETKTYPEDGREPPVYPYSKWNVLQWFGNVEGIDPSYQPTWPEWKRAIYWWFRNPFFNFKRFVIGTEDRIITVTGDAPVFTTVALEYQPTATGWKRVTIEVDGWKLPFRSYTGEIITYDKTPSFFRFKEGKQLVWYAGWVPSGGRFDFKLNFADPIK